MGGRTKFIESSQTRPLPPISLSDDELASVLAAARLLAPERRDALLEGIASAVCNGEHDGNVDEIVRQVMRKLVM
jgi:hypothetical protein